MGYPEFRCFCRIALLAMMVCAWCQLCASQVLSGTHTLLVMPFENQSKAPGIEWISEAFPEVLAERMSSPRVYVVSRSDRIYAFDHAGIPLAARPSRATVYRIAEQMDADYVVLGTYDFDGSKFTASAQLLDMKKLHLDSSVQSSGPLTDLITIQTGLAWELLRQMPDPPPLSREQFLRASTPIRLDAFENYIRGTLASSRQEKVRYLRDAIRLDPNYTQAILQLGTVYYDRHEYESASTWLARVPKNDPLAGEATFLLGLSEFYRGSFDKSYAAFSSLAGRLPLTEVYNNLGVVESRRGHRASAVDYFSRAVTADPRDADFRFNLAVALYKNGDSSGAARQLKEELQLRPADSEARTLLEVITRGQPASSSNTGYAGPGSGGMSASAPPHVPLERIKRNYDEASYRQLEMELHNLTAERLAKSTSQSRVGYHADRGQQLLAQNKPAEAEAEYRQAIDADYSNASAHAALATLLERKGDVSDARTEAQTSVRLQPNVEGYLVLARLSLKQNQMQQAMLSLDRALALDPKNEVAMALKHEVAQKQAASQ